MFWRKLLLLAASAATALGVAATAGAATRVTTTPCLRLRLGRRSARRASPAETCSWKGWRVVLPPSRTAAPGTSAKPSRLFSTRTAPSTLMATARSPVSSPAAAAPAAHTSSTRRNRQPQRQPRRPYALPIDRRLDEQRRLPPSGVRKDRGRRHGHLRVLNPRSRSC
jgi:hypothetical protein